ncbi:MAG TPA: D-alanyl-D-alanine carboxypeptidase family protein [Thermoleophilaceae bacterium]
MTSPSPLQGGSRRRRYRKRHLWRRRFRALLTVLIPVAGVAAAWFLLADNGATVGNGHASQASLAPVTTEPPPAAAPAPPGNPYAVSLERPDTMPFQFKHPPSAAMVFDVKTGRVLWRRNPLEILPIASITKLMTALLVVQHTSPGDEALITPDALHYTGSGVGLLPRGKHVTVKALLYGLLLPSGNDAAIALADHVAHTQPRFVAMMNAKARQLGLRCTHYVSPHGLEAGNRSCPDDLAALARMDLHYSRISTIVGSAHAIVHFPIKGGKLYLNNTNPLLRMGYPGTIGLKTGDTDEAGHCLIAIVRRGPITLGVVLLHSPNPQEQARALLNRAFRVYRG